MQTHTHGRHRPALRAWLIGCVLCLCMFVAWGQQDGMAEMPLHAQVEATQKSLQQLSRQIGQLRRSTLQASLTQQGQVRAIQQQIDGLEHHQNQLGMQLAELNHRSLQQIQDLQAANRTLTAAWWSLAVLVMLILLWVWRYRKTTHTPTAAQTPSQQRAVGAAASAPLPQAAPAHLATMAGNAQAVDIAPSSSPAPEQPTASAPTPDDLSITPTDPPSAPSPAVTSPWSAWVTADLHNTQHALSQARQGFMRPAQIEP